jgi:BTB/POZ domain
MVLIYVGEDKSGEPFSIHKEFLFYHSAYFERLFQQQDDGSLFVSQGMPSVVYKGTTREVFGLFNRYIYSGTIKEANNTYPGIPDMLRLWVLASKISTPQLQNAVIQGIFEKKCAVTVSGMLYVYKNTVPGSPLRRLLVDQGLVRRYTTECFAATFKDDLDDLPKELLADIVVAQKKLLSLGGPLSTCKVEDYLIRNVNKRA